MRVRLENNVSITAGQVHTINISVNPVVPEDAEVITDATGEISGEGDYVVRGSFGSSITITGGSPDIYLDNANIDLSRNYQIINPISITNGASPIIHVVGNNSITACDYTNVRMAGIYVDSQSSVTICGNGTDDVLTVTGGSDGAAIGGYSSDYNTDYACGDIAISNVTVYAYVVYSCVNKYPPAIGSTGDATCGSITITDAIVHARSHGIDNYSAPAIGAFSYVPDTYSRTGLINKFAHYARKDAYIAALYNETDLGFADLVTSLGYGIYQKNDKDLTASLALYRGNWSLGASYRKTYVDGNDYSITHNSQSIKLPDFFDNYREGKAWSAGVGYRFGPLKTSLSYFESQADNTRNKDEIIMFANDFQINKYLNLYAIAAHVNFRGIDSSCYDNNKGYAFVTGFGINF